MKELMFLPEFFSSLSCYEVTIVISLWQAIPDTFDVASQTEWKYPKNANTQYHYREFSEKEQDEEFKKEELNAFMTSVKLRFDEALQQNEIMNVFYDDWTDLGTGKSMSMIRLLYPMGMLSYSSTD